MKRREKGIRNALLFNKSFPEYSSKPRGSPSDTFWSRFHLYKHIVLRWNWWPVEPVDGSSVRLLVCSSARLHLPANWANSRQFLVKARGFVLQPFLLERLDVIVKPRKLTRKEISFLCWGFAFSFLFENINEIWNMSKRFSSTSNKITCTGHDNNFVTIFYRYKTGNSTSWLPSLHYYTLAVYFTQ